MLFDHGPTEFPVATAIAREARGRVIALVADLQRWLSARWQWLRPRTVPCAVAGLSMIALLASADYLAHHEVAHVDRTGVAAHVIQVDGPPEGLRLVSPSSFRTESPSSR